ncbi:hypothetical protein SRABI121_01161 [Microbacterium sp. Bi121]|nr:hypothetical protein SRABI121_01161 [Microbacterium sp. Bi121]
MLRRNSLLLNLCGPPPRGGGPHGVDVQWVTNATVARRIEA